MKGFLIKGRRLTLLTLSWWVCGLCVGCGWGYSQNVFTNPLLPSGADPWVAVWNGYYYYTETTGPNVTLWKTTDLSDLRDAETKVVWTPEANKPGSTDVWAPELHRWGNKWYIYYTADDGNNANHRIYVIENSSDDPLQGQWTLKGQVSDATNRWAIDPDLFQVNGTYYLLWSGWPGATDGEQDIYIAQLSNPWTISSPRVLISSPTYAWEQVGGTASGGGVNVNEGPEAIVHGSDVFVVFSGSACWTDAYELGALHASATANLLDPKAWTKYDHPFFQSDASAHVYGPGHNGFFQSQDGTQNWIIYHANGAAGQGCGGSRTPRMQSFTWNSDGTPNFGKPAASGALLVKPAP